jgi:hypothetical protein
MSKERMPHETEENGHEQENENTEKIGYIDPQTGTVETAKNLKDLMEQAEERRENSD